MTQPTPDELEAAFQQLAVNFPPVLTDVSQQSDTIYDIAKTLPEASTYHRLLEQQPTLVGLLSDASNGEYTLFLPVNEAWKKFAGLAEGVADARVLSMHISEHFISEAYLRSMTNVPTIYAPDTCNGPQTFSSRMTKNGIVIGTFGRFTRSSIRASNGIIYCIDEVLLPPMPLLDTLRQKGNYSTLLRAVTISGFEEDLVAQRGKGGTLFAPSDAAFASLGPDALRFLLETDEGRPYLKALLKLHYLPGNTFYSNLLWPQNTGGVPRRSTDKDIVYKGKMAKELPSSLLAGEEATKLTISITRYMSLITMAVNTAPVVEQDVVGNDYVAQGLNDVLLPNGIVGKGSQDFIAKIKTALDAFL